MDKTQPPFAMPCGGISGIPRRYLGKMLNQKHSESADHFINSTSPYPATQNTIFPVPYPAQTFAQSGTMDFSTCHKTGYKNVMANRKWHGRFGYQHGLTDFQFSICDDGIYDPNGYLGTVKADNPVRAFQGPVSNADSTPDRTRYCSLDIAATVTAHDVPHGGSIEHDVSGTWNVNKQSGQPTLDGLNVSPNTELNWALSIISKADMTRAGISLFPTGSGDFDIGDPSFRYVIWEGITGGARCTLYKYDPTIGHTGIKVFEVSEVSDDFSSSSTTHYGYDHDGGQHVTYTASVSASDTDLDWTETEFLYNDCLAPFGELQVEVTRTVNATLGDENADADVYADGATLLATWPLDDDKLYPWRTDGLLSIAPLVTRSEFDRMDLNTSWSWMTIDVSSVITTEDIYYTFDVGGAGPWVTTVTVNTSSFPWGDLDDPSDLIFPVKYRGDYGGTSLVEGIVLPLLDGQPTNQSFPLDGINQTKSLAGLSTYLGSEADIGLGFLFVSGAWHLSGFVDFTGTNAEGGTGYFPFELQAEFSAPAVDGSIVGAPQPAGYEGWFAYRFQQIGGGVGVVCDEDGNLVSVVWSWDTTPADITYGGFPISSGAAIPANATFWINNHDAALMRPYAWAKYNDPTVLDETFINTNCVPELQQFTLTVINGQPDMWLCKYAAILDIWPSQNFARPAGDDKFLMDEGNASWPLDAFGNHTAIYVGDDWDAGAKTFTPYDVNGDAIVTMPDTTGYWGGEWLDGFYPITFSGGKIHLGTKKYDLPDGWQMSQGITGDGDTAFGKLAWPDAPSLLGAVSVTPDMAGTAFTFGSGQDNFGLDSATHQESVDLLDADYNLLSTQTATRVDGSHFTVPVAALTAKFVMIHGAEKWYMNDDSTKGDFVTLEWWHDYRTNGEGDRLSAISLCPGDSFTTILTNHGFASFTQTQHCLPFVPCSPKVVCFSPNGESFPNGTTIAFPSDFAFDEDYGSMWQGVPLATMNDAIWRRPHNPNARAGASLVLWTQDEGLCLDDGTPDPFWNSLLSYVDNFYPHAPEVEARLSKRNNYGLAQNETPADAQGAYTGLGFVSPVTSSGGQQPPGPIGVDPIAQDGSPSSIVTESMLHERICALDGGCRFNGFYQSMKQGC